MVYNCTASHGAWFWRSSPIWYSYGMKLGYAFAGIYLHYKQRTGIVQCKKLHEQNQNWKAYRKEYQNPYHLGAPKKGEEPSLPDPDQVKESESMPLKVHTQNVSSFRQGSMVHIWDEEFRKKSENTFRRSLQGRIRPTSPNYQCWHLWMWEEDKRS